MVDLPLPREETYIGLRYQVMTLVSRLIVLGKTGIYTYLYKKNMINNRTQIMRSTFLAQIAIHNNDGNILSLSTLKDTLKKRGVRFSTRPVSYSSRMEEKGFLMTGKTGIVFPVCNTEIEVTIISTCGHSYRATCQLDIAEYVTALDISDWTTGAFGYLIDNLPEFTNRWKEEDREEQRRIDKENKILSMHSTVQEARLRKVSSPIESIAFGKDSKGNVSLSKQFGRRCLSLKFPVDTDAIPTTEELKNCLDGFKTIIEQLGEMIIIGEEPSPYAFPAVNECSLNTMHEAFVYLNEKDMELSELTTIRRERSYALIVSIIHDIPIYIKVAYEEMTAMMERVDESLRVFRQILDLLPSHMTVVLR